MTNALLTPDSVTERLAALGGLNRFGQPNFRCVWGGTRTHKVGGRFKDAVTVNGIPTGQVVEVVAVRELLKYHPERWHLERWIAPEKFGSQERWYEETWDDLNKIHVCGDYPADGDFEHVFYLAQCPHMYASEEEFLRQHPLPQRGQYFRFELYTEAVVEWQEERAKSGIGEWCRHCKLTSGEYIPLEENFWLFERQVKLFLMSDNVDEREQREALFEREFAKRRESRNRADAIVRNRMMAFGTIPHCYNSDQQQRHSVPDARFNPSLYQPLGKSKLRQLDKREIV